jgi:hypothetical protein
MGGGSLIAGILMLDIGLLAGITSVVRVASEAGSRYGTAGYVAAIALFPFTGTVGSVVAALAWDEWGPILWSALSLVSISAGVWLIRG